MYSSALQLGIWILLCSREILHWLLGPMLIADLYKDTGTLCLSPVTHGAEDLNETYKTSVLKTELNPSFLLIRIREVVKTPLICNDGPNTAHLPLELHWSQMK